MIDRNGTLIHLGDRVDIGGAETGVVVFSLDTNEFSPDFPKDDWSYLGRGIMIQTTAGALIFYDHPDEALEVIGVRESQN